MRGVTVLPARRLWLRLRKDVLVLPSRTLVLLFVVALLLLPAASDDPYLLRIVIQACVFAIFAASWDLLSSYSGQVSFGHSLFFGVGAYGSALLNFHWGWPPWLTIPIGAGLATASGLVVGIPCLRLRGSYLSLATLAFPLILTGILFMVPDFSGGELGISGIRPLVRSRVGYYYVAVGAMLVATTAMWKIGDSHTGLILHAIREDEVATTAMWKIGDSHTGLILHAIREDEVAARASGINTGRYKLLAFALSGLFAGFAGGLLAHFIRITGPSTLEVALSFQAVIWGIFGGVATIYGPVVGVFVLYPLTEAMTLFGEISKYRLLLFAIIVLLVLLWMPEGLTPWVRDKIETTCRRCKARNVATRTACRVCQAALG